MQNGWFYLEQDRAIRGSALAKHMMERGRYAQFKAGRPSVRARLARRLFALAVAAERQETWNVVWERLEAKGRL